MARDTAVFISYARSDGESYAQELRERLNGEPGIDLWHDRIRMESGDFEQQIKQAIDSARYLAVIMTPGALRSGWVEKEWRYARENGVCICPIKPKFQSQSTESELSVLHAALPRWMQQIQIFDFEEYWNRFVAVLRSPCTATRTPFLAPALPANLVKRPSVYKRIIDSVLDSERKNPSGKKVVLYGSGGFGKTTLALSLCHEEDVFAACDGGILWSTLGAEPSPVSELTKIYAALTGERPTFATLDDAMFAVEQKMEGKRCLFVIDDVWEPGHLKPFLQAGGQCTKLITTRRFEIAVQEAEASCRINVAELTPDEAVELLSAHLDPPPETQIRFRRLAERLGEWPLLLQLANRTLHVQVALYDEQTPLREKIDGALDWAKAEYDARGVIAFDREDAKAREDAIAKTVELSLGLLKENRARCLELGIFPEDTDVPLELLGVLWQTDAQTTNRLAQRMHDLALIKLDRSRKPGASASSGSIRLHDAMRSYFLSQLSEPWLLDAKLADTWTDPRRIAGEYALQHVAYHLAEAMADPSQIVKRGQQLLELLTNPRYREYQERHGDPAALNRQIELALERASTAVGPDLPALVAALAVLHQSYAEAERDPQAIFEAAAAGRVREAVERLELFDAEPEWNTLTRLLVAWIAPSTNPAEAKSLAEETVASCNRPELIDLLSWVQTAPGAIPAFAPPRFAQIQGYFSGIPDLYSYVAAILQRAGGAQTPQGFEPIDYSLHASGITPDASNFIAEQDGPALVVFAHSDPFSNTRFLEEYIDVHAANRYRYYRNRSLWALLKFVLVYPDGMWVRNIVRRIVAAALTVTHVDYEEFLPLAVRDCGPASEINPPRTNSKSSRIGCSRRLPLSDLPLLLVPQAAPRMTPGPTTSAARVRSPRCML